MNRPYQVCNRCVMDTSAKEITFDENGVCFFCTEFLANAGKSIHRDGAAKKASLDKLIQQIKSDGAGKLYDCIIGVSGGVDSSWVLVQAVRMGLRPLAVHMDNGWNSELAQNNIANLVRGLGVDLHTHVIEWQEYKRLMQAFFDADVIDVELLYDNAMLAVNHQTAAKYRIKYILGGTNQVTEGMRMPKEWNWFKYDKKNIKSLAKIFGGTKLRTFPSIGTFGFIWSRYVRGIEWKSILDLMDYNKDEVMSELQSTYQYKPYPYKHYESIFTRFYQGYILPEKFGVDKRRLHLGNLIASGQMARADALKLLDHVPYPDMQALQSDRQYFLKKMGWIEEDLVEYVKRPEKAHSAYGTEYHTWAYFEKMYRFLKSFSVSA
jgi:N-acetyl sugar amidotransferase